MPNENRRGDLPQPPDVAEITKNEDRELEKFAGELITDTLRAKLQKAGLNVQIGDVFEATGKGGVPTERFEIIGLRLDDEVCGGVTVEYRKVAAGQLLTIAACELSYSFRGGYVVLK